MNSAARVRVRVTWRSRSVKVVGLSEGAEVLARSAGQRDRQSTTAGQLRCREKLISWEPGNARVLCWQVLDHDSGPASYFICKELEGQISRTGRARCAMACTGVGHSKPLQVCLPGIC